MVGLGLAVGAALLLAPLSFELLVGLVQAAGGGVVERVVAATADVVGHADALVLATELLPSVETAATRGGRQRERRGRDARGSDLGYPAQEGPLH